MIGTTKKPLEEILQALEGYEKIAVVGCDGCAKVCATGGLDQVKEMAQDLKGKGKNITLEVSPERTCNIMKSREALDPCKDQIAAADAVLVLGCGGAVQIARQTTEEYRSHHPGQGRPRLRGPHGYGGPRHCGHGTVPGVRYVHPQ